MITCPYCHLQLQDGINFCPRCGTPLSAQAQTYLQQNPYLQRPQQPVNNEQAKQQQSEAISNGIAKGCGAFILVAIVLITVVLIALQTRGI